MAIGLIVLAATFAFTTASNATLSGGTTFEGSDGNLVASGGTDWANVAGLHPGLDDPSGTSDNSFGQGTKEDNSAVTVVSGSIPPNKSDLTRFYEASETVNSNTYLYLAWERTNVLGNANMDFEINQNATTGFDGSTVGKVTINRTNGDILVNYDFSGSGTPTLAINRWLVSGQKNPDQVNHPGNNTVSECYSANTLPCWGNHVTLTSANSEGAVNTVTVTDPIGPNAGRQLAANTFGEAAINLTGAGIINSSTACSFGGATTFLKSRSSSSFTAEIKDFVAPVSTPIVSQCGTVNIIKATDPAGINQDFGFTSSLGGSATPVNCTTDTTPASFTLNAAGTTEETCTGVAAGNYTVTEGTEPSNFSLESLTCTATDSTGATSTNSSGTQHSAGSLQADITLAANDTVTCTYTNQQLLGAIKITKTSTKGSAYTLAGADFTITGPNSYSHDVTTGSDGTVCVDSLPFGTYHVSETGAPTGFDNDNSTAQDVVVNASSSCGDGSEATYSASDTPLTDLSVDVKGEVASANGGTQSNIVCVDSTNTDVGNSPQPASGNADHATVTANGLRPGTYTCTVTIDP